MRFRLCAKVTLLQKSSADLQRIRQTLEDFGKTPKILYKSGAWEAGMHLTLTVAHDHNDMFSGKQIPLYCYVVIVLGLAVPTVRDESENLVSRSAGSGTLIRINPCEPQVPDGHIGLRMTGLKALQQLQEIYETL